MLTNEELNQVDALPIDRRLKIGKPQKTTSPASLGANTRHFDSSPATRVQRANFSRLVQRAARNGAD
jgi:hypothetical protein